MRWPDVGELRKDGWTLYYSESKHHVNGVGILISPDTANAVTAVKPVNDRIVCIRVDAKLKPFNIIQVFFPTGGVEDEKVIEVYRELQMQVDSVRRKSNSDHRRL